MCITPSYWLRVERRCKLIQINRISIDETKMTIGNYFSVVVRSLEAIRAAGLWDWPGVCDRIQWGCSHLLLIGRIGLLLTREVRLRLPSQRSKGCSQVRSQIILTIILRRESLLRKKMYFGGYWVVPKSNHKVTLRSLEQVTAGTILRWLICPNAQPKLKRLANPP